MSDSESSVSEVDCEALVNSFEQESFSDSATSSTTKQNKFVSKSKVPDVSQQAIIVQILSQLDKLGKHLDNSKQNVVKQSDIDKGKGQNVKKVVSSPVASTPSHQVPQIPDLNTLREDVPVKALVDQRLKHLADNEQKNTKIKSLRGGSIEVLVSNRVKWPHEYVLSGVSKECTTYDQLSVCQWVAGLCHIMKEEKNLNLIEHMLD